MNENKVYKNYKKSMMISPEFIKSDDTNVIIYSFDISTGKFTYDLKKLGQDFNLSSASDITIALHFGGDRLKYPVAKLIGDIEDRLKGRVSFVMPKQYLGYEGRVLGEIDISFTNGQSMTAGYFSFVMKKSLINNNLEPEQQVYVEQFEDLKNMINQKGQELAEAAEGFNKDNNFYTKEEIDKEIDDIRDQISSGQGGNRGFQVNVKNFGAKGDGKNDDTVAINDAVKYASNNNLSDVVFPDGTYMIKAHVDHDDFIFYLMNEGGIQLKDNINLIMSKNTTLKAISTSARAYNIIQAWNTKNHIISGGRIEGTIGRHPEVPLNGKKDECGYGIAFYANFSTVRTDKTGLTAETMKVESNGGQVLGL